MADTIRLKAPTVEQTVVVNIQGEEQLKSFANTLDKVSKGRNLQKYWKDQQSLIKDTVTAYKNFNRVANQDNASELLKVTNALKAMGNTDISSLSSELRNIVPSIQQAEKLAGTLVDSFSISSFKEAFASFDALRAYGVDMEKLFNHFGNNASVEELNAELKHTYDIIAESETRINTLQNRLQDAESGRGIAAIREECKALRQEIDYVREEAEQTFSNFLAFHNVSDNSYEAQRFFDEIREGSLSAQEAIAQFKRRYTYLLEDNVSFDSTQLQDFSQKLDSVLQKAKAISEKIEEISTNGVKVSGNDSVFDADALSNTLREITDLNTTDDVSNIYKSLANILTIIKEIGQLDNYNITDLSSVFRNLTKLNDLKINKASLTNLADCLDKICKTTNTTTLSSLSTVDLNKFNELHISKASLKNLAEYLPQIAAINTDQLIALTQIDFSNLNNLQIDKTSLKNLQEFVENLKINIQENDAEMTTSGVNNSQEITLMQYLANEVNKVTTAVDLKTRAFQEEEQIVEGTVQREISNLQALDGQLSIIVDTLQTIKSLADSLKLNITIDDNTTSNVTGQNNNTSGTVAPHVSGKAKRKLIATEKSNNKSNLTYQDEQTGRQITEEWRRNKNGQWTSTTKETTRYAQLEKEAIKYAKQLLDSKRELDKENLQNKPDAGIISSINDQIDLLVSRLGSLYEQALNYDVEQGLGAEYTFQQFLDSVLSKTDEHSAKLDVKMATDIKKRRDALQKEKDIRNKKTYQEKIADIQNYKKAQEDLDSLLTRQVQTGESNELTAEITAQQKLVDELKIKAIDASKALIKMKKAGDISSDQKRTGQHLLVTTNKRQTTSALTLQGSLDDQLVKHTTDIDEVTEKYKKLGFTVTEIQTKLLQLMQADKACQQSVSSSIDERIDKELAYKGVLQAVEANINNIQQQQNDQKRQDQKDTKQKKQQEATDKQNNQDYNHWLQYIEDYEKAQTKLESLVNKELNKKNASGQLTDAIIQQQQELEKLKNKALQALQVIDKMMNSNQISKFKDDDAWKKYNDIILRGRDAVTSIKKLDSNHAYVGLEKDYEDQLTSYLSNQVIDDGVFKSLSVDHSGKTTITFLEAIGDKAREVKYVLDDANDALDLLINGEGLSDVLSTGERSDGILKKISEEDKKLFDDNAASSDYLEQINAFQQLIKTEDKYQKMRAKANAGKLSTSQLAEFDLLQQARDRWNDSIKQTIQLTKEEKEIFYGSKRSEILDEYGQKYLDQQKSSDDVYKAYMKQYMISESDPRYKNIQASLKQTQQLIDNFKLSNISGFDSVFKEAEIRIESLNSALQTGNISIDEYGAEIKDIISDLQSVVSIIERNDVSKARYVMEKYVKDSGGIQIGNFDNELNSLTYIVRDHNGEVQKMTLTYSEATGQIKKFSVASQQVNKVSSALKSSFKSTVAPLASFIKNSIEIYEVFQVLKNGIGIIKDLDVSLTEMRKVSGESYESLKNYQKISFDIASSIGTTAKQIQDSTADYMRLGYDLSTGSVLAKDANIYANVGDMDIDTATEHMISSIQAWKSEFGSDVEASAAIIDRYNEIGNNFAITSADIGSAMERSAAALKAGGNTLNEALGLITAGNIIQQDADTTANALKVMSLRIRGSKTELEEMGEETDGLASSTSKLREEIKALSGIDIMIDENTYKSTAQIIQQIGAVFNQLSDVSQAALLEKLAGKTRASTVAGLLENYQVIGEVIESAENAEGSALRENENYLNSIQGKTAQLTNKVHELAYNILDTDLVKSFLDVAIKVVDILDKITDKLGSLSSILAATFGYVKVNDFLGKLTGETSNKSNLFGTLLEAAKEYVLSASLNDIELPVSEESPWDHWIKNADDMVEGIDNIGDAADVMDNIGDAANRQTTSLDKLKDKLKSTGELLKGFFKSSLGMATTGIVGITAGLIVASKLFDHINKMRGLDYDTNVENATSAISSYEEVENKLESVNTKLEETQTLINSLESKDKLTLTEQAELEKLQLQNDELERQKQILDSIMQSKKQTVVRQAALALDTTSDSDVYNAKVENNINGMAYASGNDVSAVKMNDADQIKELALEIQNVESQLEHYNMLKLEATNTSDVKKYEKEIKKLEQYEDDLNFKLSERLDTASEFYSQIAFSEEHQDLAKEYAEAFSFVEEIDMSPAEKELSQIERFFNDDSNNLLAKKFKELGKEGKLIGRDLRKLGITVDQIGKDVNLSSVIKYFNDMASAADNAEKSIKSLTATENIDAVTNALDSSDPGANYEKALENAETIKELYSEKLIGKDEFKAFSDYLSYGADDSVDAYEHGIGLFNRYFHEDDYQGALNFINDLQLKGQELSKNWVTGDAASGWTFDVDNIAEAAKEMGIGVGMFEDILGRLKDYGFDIEWTSVIEGLNDYQTSLSGIKEIYDNMDDGEAKEALKLDIEQWESDLELYEDDLSQLDEEKVVRIKLAYETLQTEEEIQKALAKARAQGNTSEAVNQYANVIVGQESIIQNTEEVLGLNQEGITIPLKPDLTSLYEELGKVQTDEERIEIQTKIVAEQDEYMEQLDYLLDSGFEITPDMSVEDINKELDKIINGDYTAEIEAKVSDKDKAINDMAEILGVPMIQDISFDLSKMSKDEVENKIQELMDTFGTQTIDFNADVNGVIDTITAVRDEEGKITYSADIDGVQTEVQPVQGLFGTLTYRPVTTEVDAEESDTDGGTRETVFTPITKAVDAEVAKTYGGRRKVTFWADTTSVSSAISSLATSITLAISAAGASGTMLSPAFAYGTGYNAFNLIPGSAYANGKVSLPKNETALVNEMGTESIIRDGKWFLIPGGMHTEALKKGDIILSASQTESLLRSGRAIGHGKAYASGTIGTKISNAYDVGSFTGSGGFHGGASGSGGSSSGNSGGSSGSSDGSDESKEKLDWIERKIKDIERDIENLDQTASATYKSWSERNSALTNEIAKVTEEIDIQQKAYERYMQEANSVGLSDEYAKKVMDGTIDIESIEDEDLRNKISEFQEWYDKAVDCQDAVQDLQDNLAELTKTKFENVVSQFEDLLSVIEHTIDMLDGVVNQIETEGYIVSTKVYEALKEQQENQRDTKISERNALIKELEEALATPIDEGGIAYGSSDYYEMLGEIQACDKEIQDLNTDIAETNNLIRETPWNVFDKMQEMIGEVNDEADFYIGLMSDENMFNPDDASITKEGQATFGLHGVKYNTLMSQADDYLAEIAKLDKELEKDPFNQTLLDQRQKWVDSYRDVVNGAEDEKQAIIDLVKEGYDTFLSVMDKAIDKRKEMLSTTKDLYDYEKNVSDQVEEISKLEKQLKAYGGDTSEATKATVQQLKVSLEEAKENLEETEYERYIQDQEKMLDSFRDETQEWIDDRLQNPELLLQGIIDSTNNNAQTIKETLEKEAGSIGTTLSDAMSAIWSPDGTFGTVVTTYTADEKLHQTTVEQELNNIRQFIENMSKDADKKAGEKIDNPTGEDGGSKNKKPEPEPPKQNPPKQDPPKQDPPKEKEITVGSKINAGNARIYANSRGTGGGRQYFANDPIYTVIGEENGYVRVRWHKASSGSSGWFKKSDVKAYSTGGLVDYDGLAAVHGGKKPELVLNSKDTENFIALKDVLKKIDSADLLLGQEAIASLRDTMNVLKPFIDSSAMQIPQMSARSMVQNVSIEIGDIQMYGVNDPEAFAAQLKHTLQTNKSITKIIQADTLGIMTGKNGLSKFKY